MDVDVWTRDTSAAPPDEAAVAEPGELADLLDVHERERWSRLVDRRSATAYLELHVLARREIARVLGRSPAALRFDRTCPDCDRQHGAPRLLDDPGLHLSLSRSGTVVALALSRAGRVGVDVDRVARTGFRGFEEVALHPDERDHVRTANARATAWVRKEAVLKALGVGLRVDPATFVTPLTGVPRIVLPGSPAVSVSDLAVQEGYAAAVALAVPDPAPPGPSTT